MGEGYYAERTSKQTVEILQRRGKSLDSQVDSLEANIKDLEAEASFFNATASQVAVRVHFFFVLFTLSTLMISLNVICFEAILIFDIDICVLF